MDVVLDDHLHSEAHVNDAHADEEQHQHGDEGRGQEGEGGGVVGPGKAHEDGDEGERQGDECRAGDPLAPEIRRARFGGAEAPHAAERCLLPEIGHAGHPPTRKAKTHIARVSTTEPTIVA
jgi:hypothetical protein